MKRRAKTILAALAFSASSLGYAAGHGSNHDMTMHHMHVMINHAVEMAAEGSNLIMLGQMGMAGGIDELSISHGHSMIKHAQSLIVEVVEGKPMESLHKEGVTGEASAEMVYTHELANSASSYIELLSRMSQVPGHKN